MTVDFAVVASPDAATREALRGRGVGARLIRMAESIAAQCGCIGVWVDTFGFQAHGFHEKLGDEVFGTLDDHPRGSHRFFLRRRLAGSTR